MESSDVRRGIINQGAFFSPYYLFDLMARQHADELDHEGRDANRRALRRPFRAAWARYSETGSTLGQAWQAWHRELFEALGFALDRLPGAIETPRHGLVPISHAAPSPPAPLPHSGERGNGKPLVLVDLHGFCTDLDRARYPNAGTPLLNGEVTEEPIARAIEFALDAGESRWALVAAGDRLRLYRKGGSVARQYLEVNFPALFDGDRNEEWTAFWGLFRHESFVPDPGTGKCFLDRVLEESQRHASRIADDLRENIVLAVEALIQGILDHPANRTVVRTSDARAVRRLFEESLYFLYRLLFILYAESRDLLPVGESEVYRAGYSVEHLREMAERSLHAEDADRTYYMATLRTLFAMLHRGFPLPGSAVNPGFAIPPYDGQLFDPSRTALLDRCHVPDRAMRQVIRELSLSRPRRRGDRRERYSYADLGVDQLGSIYEGLLVYEPAIVTETTVVAKVKGEERVVSLAQAEEYRLEIVEGSERRPGSFVLRLWGGRRKGTGSYYTPQEITSFLVKEALEPLAEPIVQGCAERDRRGRPKRHPDEILELKVCDPAMGSGAFLIQACRYLAEAYGRARIAAGMDEDERLSSEEYAHYKRRVAEKCLYGVDLNPLAVELAKVSLWLETMARDRPLTFLDSHLRCGNSLIGAPLRDAEGQFSVQRLTYIPDEALEEVGKEATKEQKAAARARIKRNRIERARAGRGDVQQFGMKQAGMWDQKYADAIEQALADTLAQRLDLEASDEDLPVAGAVELVHHKEQVFDALQHAPDSRYRQVKAVCDLWCAAWFWPEPGTVIEVEVDGEMMPTVVPEPPTTQYFLELAGGILEIDPGSLTNDQRQDYLLTAGHIARQQRFFHWELELPEVWQEKDGRPRKNGGFAAAVGNPPWEAVKPNSQEFWSNYDPLFRALGKQQALRYATEMRADTVRDKEWRAYYRGMAQMAAYLKKTGHYRFQGQGDTNTYKLFLERSQTLLHETGGLSLVLPSGFYTDLGSAQLRQLLFEAGEVHYILALVNERFIFPSVDHRFRFVLLSARHGGSTTCVRTVFRLTTTNAVRPDELGTLLANPESQALQIPLDVVRQFSPGTLALLELKSEQEVDIVSRIYDEHPLLGSSLGTAWNAAFDSGVHMTNDSALFEPVGQPVVEGKCFHQYNPLWAGPTHYIPQEVILANFQRKRLAQLVESAFASDGFLRFRAVARSTDERTSIAAICPPLSIHEGNAPAILISEPSPSVRMMVSLYLCGVYNSLALDFIVRLRVSAKVNIATLEQLPIPRLGHGDEHFDDIAARSAQLSYIFPQFADLWTRVTRYFPDEFSCEQELGPSAIDPCERAQLRAEIDALVADLYCLSEEDFAYILTTFPLLDRDQPPLPGDTDSSGTPKSYITRDLALLELFKMRGKTPPADIVAFFAQAGVDIAPITGPIHDLAERVAEATRLGAVAYVPSRRGGGEASEEMEVENEEGED